MNDVKLLPCPLCSHALDEAGACQWCARCDATMAAWNEYSRPALTPKQAAADVMFDALRDIVTYSGGADNALEDEYVMDRARAALAKAGQP